MYQYIAQVLFDKLSEDEWRHVATFIEKAKEMGSSGREDMARKALQAAAMVAASYEKYDAAMKIEYYLRF